MRINAFVLAATASVLFTATAYADNGVQMLPPTPFNSLSPCSASTTSYDLLLYSGPPASGTATQGAINCINTLSSDGSGNLTSNSLLATGYPKSFSTGAYLAQNGSVTDIINYGGGSGFSFTNGTSSLFSIDNSGNITTPVTIQTNSSTALTLVNSDGSSNKLTFTTNNNSSTGSPSIRSNGNDLILNASAKSGSSIFLNQDSGSNTYINSNGNGSVGINTSNIGKDGSGNSYKLDVSGTTNLENAVTIGSTLMLDGELTVNIPANGTPAINGNPVGINLPVGTLNIGASGGTNGQICLNGTCLTQFLGAPQGNGKQGVNGGTCSPATPYISSIGNDGSIVCSALPPAAPVSCPNSNQYLGSMTPDGHGHYTVMCQDAPSCPSGQYLTAFGGTNGSSSCAAPPAAPVAAGTCPSGQIMTGMNSAGPICAPNLQIQNGSICLNGSCIASWTATYDVQSTICNPGSYVGYWPPAATYDTYGHAIPQTAGGYVLSGGHRTCLTVCPSGEKPISGGCWIGNMSATSSSAMHPEYNGWECSTADDSAGETAQVTCVPQSYPTQ